MSFSQTQIIDKYCVGEIYLDVKRQVIEAGYEKEIQWQESVLKTSFTENDLMREAAWVILCTGFKETIVRKRFKNISSCFYNWKDAKEIVDHKRKSIEGGLKYINNKRKMSAITKIAEIICGSGFAKIKNLILGDPIGELKKLPYIGDVTSYHLAKNLGFNLAKPDRHLIKIAEIFGYDNVQDLCKEISNNSGDPIAVVDIILWRFATIRRDYVSYFSSKYANYL